MSLNKAINHGKEYRQNLKWSHRYMSVTDMVHSRSHKKCKRCFDGIMHNQTRRKYAADEQIREASYE
jgi:hypothetical protein